VCEGNICVEPACVVDDDCDGDTVICNTGRCESYTPCATDPDCFDANLRCDTEAIPVRCVERPTCSNDAACGLTALCLDNHCRPVDSCLLDDDCVDASDECVGGRCVSAAACRSSADCSADKACVNTRCVPTEAVTPDAVLLGDDAGLCAGCTRVLVVDEVNTFASQAYAAGEAAFARTTAVSSDEDAVGVDIDLKGVEISNCDVLVIEGNVDATVHSKAMEILAPGRLTGTATIDIWPNLREGLADNAAIVTSNAVGTFRLAANGREWDIGIARVYGLRFSAVEAL
jgi:hypothetical protein